MQDESSKLLLVDDDWSLREVLATVLTRGGYEVVAASSGAEALRLAAATPFDVALVDYEMPQMDGIELLHRLRDLQPACQRILLTGRLDLDVAVEAVNRGEIARALRKPMRAAALLQEVREVIEARGSLLRACADLERAGRDAERRRQAEELAACLSGDAVTLAVQPIVRAGDLRVVAYEALLRSTHPVLRGPADLLRAAEEHGMLDRLGQAVVDRAAAWLRALPDDVRLFVNLHPWELADREALCRRLAALEPWADRVVLEITERSSLETIEDWEHAAGTLANLGFSLALDDLGAGYSSLSLMAALQPSYVKVDMSIVRDVDTVPRKLRLVEVLCRFAEAAGALVVAEGVETAGEARALRGCGVHLLQGYLFGRPSSEPLAAPTVIELEEASVSG